MSTWSIIHKYFKRQENVQFSEQMERERQRTYSNLDGPQAEIAVATCHGGSRQPIGPTWAQFACWCLLIIKFLDSWWISLPITTQLSIATEVEIVWSDHYGIQRGISLSCCMCHAIIVICLNESVLTNNYADLNSICQSIYIHPSIQLQYLSNLKCCWRKSSYTSEYRYRGPMHPMISIDGEISTR